MESRIQHCDFTIMVCTPVYAQRVGHRAPPGAGRGVMWEATLLYNLLYHDDDFRRRAVPVLLGDATVAGRSAAVPRRLLRSARPDGMRALLERIFAVPDAMKPPLGERPDFRRAVPAPVRSAEMLELPVLPRAVVQQAKRELAAELGPIAPIIVDRAAASARWRTASSATRSATRSALPTPASASSERSRWRWRTDRKARRPMRLLTKFSLIFLVVFAVGAALAGKVCHDFLRQSALAESIAQADLMMQSAMATRTYTTRQIKPSTSIHRSAVFRAQWVPAYAATQVFRYVHDQRDYADYSYREPALNPTNPQDRATGWEVDVVSYFRNDSTQAKLTGERGTVTGRSLFVAQPIRAVAACMECHSSAAAAPAAMIKAYGPSNGFGWKVGEVVGAQIVSVPMSVPLGRADSNFRVLMTSLGMLAVLTLIVLNAVLAFAVIRPVSRLAANADEISKGNLHVNELKVKGRDEIGVLAESFNRMHRSLKRAMKMLGSR